MSLLSGFFNKTLCDVTARLFIVSLLFVSGCYTPVHSPPEEMLERSLSGVMGKDEFSFRGFAEVRVGENMILMKQFRYEGAVRQHQGTHMRLSRNVERDTTSKRWNPLRHLEELRAVPKRVSLLRVPDSDDLNMTSSGNPIQVRASNLTTSRASMISQFTKKGAIPLNINVRPHDAKKMLSQYLQEDYESIVIPNKQLERVRGQLSASAQQELANELNAEAEQGRQRLTSMLENATVNATYVLWVDQKRQLPLALETQMTAAYKVEGQPRQETIRMVSEFVNYR
ncbi:hypothetical protein [Paenibacillus sp. 481]|uniref:hypothetical protein n=1 Tax=Paenibacillus sp. 481 TaxID=2835869 RepID=UPI001E64F1DC|nr:hypothetical protein [Paenibacillus sp. 481]UHA74058.1 hypothetical protein KIK04_02580 [Paenibacillus sp. 481]